MRVANAWIGMSLAAVLTATPLHAEMAGEEPTVEFQPVSIPSTGLLYILLVDFDYQEPLAPMNNRGGSSRMFVIDVPHGSNLTCIAHELGFINRRDTFDDFTRG